MAGLVALAIILLAAVQVESDASRKDVNDMRLNDLQDKVDELQGILEERGAIRDQRLKEFSELQSRVAKLKGSRCGVREFQCTNSAIFCIHDILVCDGAKDCPDGSDEEFCTNPAKAGSTFTGVTNNIKCSTGYKGDVVRFDIIGEKRYNDFPAIVFLEVQTSIDGQTLPFKFDGVYSYGQKALVVYDKKQGGVAMICRFFSADSMFCDAEFMSIVSKKVCGTSILTKS